MNQRYRVSASIEYVDGNLAGLTLPYVLNHATAQDAQRTVEWIADRFARQVEVKASVTAKRYRFTTAAVVEKVSA